jgi:hypothetical protein
MSTTTQEVKLYERAAPLVMCDADRDLDPEVCLGTFLGGFASGAAATKIITDSTQHINFSMTEGSKVGLIFQQTVWGVLCLTLSLSLYVYVCVEICM